MDTRYAALKIVGWYHTHPDFGIFLSDRDRFIQEHFFSSPGQIAHVIDPIRKLEGVFVWKDGKPSQSEHFWVGDRILIGALAGWDGLAEPPGSLRRQGLRGGPDPAHGSPSEGRGAAPVAEPAGLLPPPGQLMIYGCVFLVGYLLSSLLAAWERQKFVESQLASNGLISVLRLGLSDELDQLQRELSALARPLEAVRSRATKADEPLGEIRSQLASTTRRITAIKERYGCTRAEEELLRRTLIENIARSSRSGPPAPQEPRANVPVPAPSVDEANKTK
jgi:hypothetical protein